MLFPLLSFLDMVAAATLIGGHYEFFRVPLLYMALYLVGKLIFWQDAFTIIDAIAAIYFVFVFFGHASALTWIFVVWFVYKFSIWLFSAMGH